MSREEINHPIDSCFKIQKTKIKIKSYDPKNKKVNSKKVGFVARQKLQKVGFVARQKLQKVGNVTRQKLQKVGFVRSPKKKYWFVILKLRKMAKTCIQIIERNCRPTFDFPALSTQPCSCSILFL